MINAGAAAAFRIDHQQNKTFGVVGNVAPRQLGGDILANAIRIVWRMARLLATLLGIIVPSAKVVDLSAKSPAASDGAVAKLSASVIIPVVKIRSVIIVFL